MEVHGHRVERACVIGLGRSNLALIRYLHRQGVRLWGRDRAQSLPHATADELERLGVPVTLGENYLAGLGEFDALFITPGMRKDIPELQAARADGMLLSSEMRLFFERCRAPIVGVTGSSGKTTTTTLIGEILAADGRKVLVGGNIGTPLIEQVDDLDPGVVVVLELSSFQLELLDRSPDIAVVTNITPNHLDIHDDMAHYIAAKRRIVAWQREGDVAVLNADDPEVRGFADGIRSRVSWFGDSAATPDVQWTDERLRLRLGDRFTPVCDRSEIRLLGRHNIGNILAAATAASVLGVGADAIRTVVTTFPGVPHRLELVKEIAGVRYVNDSIATTPIRAAAGVRAFAEPVVLIAGGYDKKLPFDPLAQAVCYPEANSAGVTGVVVLGDTAEQIVSAIESAAAGGGRQPIVLRAHGFDDAVAQAARLARPGSVVLLSPACASYDMFRNFEERAARFRQLVTALPESAA